RNLANDFSQRTGRRARRAGNGRLAGDTETAARQKYLATLRALLLGGFDHRGTPPCIVALALADKKAVRAEPGAIHSLAGPTNFSLSLTSNPRQTEVCRTSSPRMN